MAAVSSGLWLVGLVEAMAPGELGRVCIHMFKTRESHRVRAANEVWLDKIMWTLPHLRLIWSQFRPQIPNQSNILNIVTLQFDLRWDVWSHKLLTFHLRTCKEEFVKVSQWWKVTKYIYSSTSAQRWGTLPEYFHFMLLSSSTAPHLSDSWLVFRLKYQQLIKWFHSAPRGAAATVKCCLHMNASVLTINNIRNNKKDLQGPFYCSMGTFTLVEHFTDNTSVLSLKWFFNAGLLLIIKYFYTAVLLLLLK